MPGTVEFAKCDENQHAVEQIHAVSIALSSPDDIRSFSSGEVTEPVAFSARARTNGGTISSKQLVRGGLLCERIFGPLTSYRCGCGKYRGGKRARERDGMVCDVCGVAICDRDVRRHRMGHIELAAPVVHPFFFCGLPSVLAELFSATVRAKEPIAVTNEAGVSERVCGNTSHEPHLSDVKLTPKVLRQIIYHERSLMIEGCKEVLTGAEAIQALLKALEGFDLCGLLQAALGRATSNQRRDTLSALYECVKAQVSGRNRLEWMVLEVLPVVPASCRGPTVLDARDEAGRERIEVGDLNRLYGRVIRTNNSLKELLSDDGPRELVRRRKQSLQRAVVALFENEGLARPVKSASGRPLVSILGRLKGKTGRFRGSLLAKRVDYSGRAVIVVNPKLRISQCGLPKRIAWELYRPFVLRRLNLFGLEAVKERLARDAQFAEQHLRAVMAEHPVLLNRAPTLHRMNVQAFFPVLTRGNAIEVHPLICRAFTADFDGDQMAVHLPLSVNAILEAKTLLRSRENLISPANGSVMFRPTQDMVLGLYYLTMEGPEEVGPRKAFSSLVELELARTAGVVHVHQAIEYRVAPGRDVVPSAKGQGKSGGPERIKTTVGRALFDGLLGEGMPFYNMPLGAKELDAILSECIERLGQDETLRLAEEMALLGAAEATRSGLSLGVSDLLIPKSKDSIIKKANAMAQALSERAKVQECGKEPERSDASWKAKEADIWSGATAEVAAAVLDALRGESRAAGSINPVLVMAESGARGSISQLKQLSGMRGLMARPTGELAERVITSNFREGLSITEYFVSTHGSHKSFIDVGLKTAEGGYLTRRLVHAASRVVVTMHDCHASEGVSKHAQDSMTLGQAVLGRTSLEELRCGRLVLLQEHELVTPAVRQEIETTRRRRLRVRSPLTCRAASGVCALCYGMDRSTGQLVEVGAAVGVIAAQSVGEPGTQLTMLTKHTGGVAGDDITGGLGRVDELFEARCQRLRELFSKRGPSGTWQYLLDELQAPYRAQGVRIDDKHFEIIISQMLGQVRVSDGGDSTLLPGALIDRQTFDRVNAALPIDAKKARGKRELLGITQTALSNKSFLAAASFREPKRVLCEAALGGRTDPLAGITEKLIVGGLIPAGSGFDEDALATKAEEKTGLEPKKKRRVNNDGQPRPASSKLSITLDDPKAAKALSIRERDGELETLVTGLGDEAVDKQRWDRVIQLGWDRLFAGIYKKHDAIDKDVAHRLTGQVFQAVIDSKTRFGSAKAFWAFVWRQRKWQVGNYLAREGARRKRERHLLGRLLERDEWEHRREAEAKAARGLLAKIKDEAMLTGYQSEVFDLAWSEGLADLEIARQLEKSNGAIRRTKSHIKRKLRDTPTAQQLRRT